MFATISLGTRPRSYHLTGSRELSHVENNTLSIHGERKFDSSVNQADCLCIERAYGTPKREESKPKQIKIAVAANGK